MHGGVDCDSHDHVTTDILYPFASLRLRFNPSLCLFPSKTKFQCTWSAQQVKAHIPRFFSVMYMQNYRHAITNRTNNSLILMSSHVESHHILFSSCISHNVISHHRTLKSKRESRCAQKTESKDQEKLNQMPQNSSTTAPRIAVALLFAAFRPQLFFGE